MLVQDLGSWRPTWTIPEVIAVRGQRIAAMTMVNDFGNDMDSNMIVYVRLDPQLKLRQLWSSSTLMLVTQRLPKSTGCTLRSRRARPDGRRRLVGSQENTTRNAAQGPDSVDRLNFSDHLDDVEDHFPTSLMTR